MNNVEVLKTMRAELMQRINALDSAISVLEQIHNDVGDQLKVEETPEPKMHKGKVGKMQFESAIDLTKLSAPDSPWTCKKCGAFNPAGQKTCLECKTKRPSGIRTD